MRATLRYTIPRFDDDTEERIPKTNYSINVDSRNLSLFKKELNGFFFYHARISGFNTEEVSSVEQFDITQEEYERLIKTLD